MSTRPAYQVTDRDTLWAFLERHPFATFITVKDGLPHACHIPLTLDRGRGPSGTLVGHLAKRNAQAAHLLEGAQALCLFHGPHAYVSPDHYVRERDVPTWNYAVAHARGPIRPLSAAETAPWLDRLTREHEAPRGERAFTVDPATRDALIGGILGFEVEITELTGRFKLGQNRSAEDRAGPAEAFLASPDPALQEVGRMMLKPPTGA